MAGHGSPPPDDQANHPARQVSIGWNRLNRVMSESTQPRSPLEMMVARGRPVVESGRGTAEGRVGGVLIPANTRNPYTGQANVLEERGGRHLVVGGRSGGTPHEQHQGMRAVSVRTRYRANVAARNLARRGASGRNVHTGRS